MQVLNYQIDHNLYVSPTSLVYRAHRQPDNKPVILKLLRDAKPTSEKIAWFKRESAILNSLQFDGVPLVYELADDHARPVLVLEDFGGDSLTLLQLAGKLDLEHFFTLALQVAEIVAQVHQRGVMHKDVTPGNIVYNPETGQVKLIDFGLATSLERESPGFFQPQLQAGTLAYMSPEQTGRMNRIVDYRTDLYALGVTLYELLTGELPFTEKDALGLVHAHIAKSPCPPHELRPALPATVSAIILKLMAKNAEDRYQSAESLSADLSVCLQQWQTTGKIQPFPLGRLDAVARLNLSQKFYGREAELDALLSAFASVSQGESELILVTGEAGIGKTMLVQEIFRPVTEQRGYFIAGKFEQLQHNVPYAALLQALRALVKYLLASSDQEIAAWRQRLLNALGLNGQVILELIPELELIIGPQPVIPPLDPMEAKNRLHWVFQDFIRALAQAEHPLVIFLDDLQWADSASIQLLRFLLTTHSGGYILLICAWRASEIYAEHPVALLVDELEKNGINARQITLTPLTLHAVTQLVEDTFFCPPAQAQPLAQLLIEKTAGNPFFIGEFLTFLWSRRLIQFIPAVVDEAGQAAEPTTSGRWHWNMEEIRRQKITDNVVELMAAKVLTLAPATQQLLKLAACMGSRFALDELARASDQPQATVATTLWPAIEQGLVLPLEDTYRLAEQAIATVPPINCTYQFAHDRIQQAVYGLLASTERSALHNHLGQLLWQQLPAPELEQQLFTVVDHLNAGYSPGQTTQTTLALAELNLRAGRKAKAAIAYTPALNYFQTGRELLAAHGWKRQYELMLQLNSEAVEAAYLSNNYGQMEQFAAEVLAQAQTFTDKIKIYEAQIQAAIAQHQPLAAIQIARTVLPHLGARLPERPRRLQILFELAQVKLVMATKRPEAFIKLPSMTDPAKLAAMRIFTKVVMAVYIAQPALLAPLVLSVIKLSLRYGNTPISAFAYANYGIIVSSILGQVKEGYRFGQLALTLLDQFPQHEMKARTAVTVAMLLRHTHEPIKALLTAFEEGYQFALETGEPEVAGHALSLYGIHALCAGMPLVELAQKLTSLREAATRIGQTTIEQWLRMYHQFVLNLLGKATVPYRLDGTAYEQNHFHPMQQAANDVIAATILHSHEAILCYLFEQYPAALQALKASQSVRSGPSGLTEILTAYFYDSLIRLALYPEQPSAEQPRTLKRVRKNQKQLQRWMKFSPANYSNKYHLVTAEVARIEQDYGAAREHYDQAIALAKQHGFLNEEALAYEVAGRFYLAREQQDLAFYYLRHAHAANIRWGAQAKVQHLEARYPDCFAQPPVPYTSTAVSTTITDTSSLALHALDLSSVIKTSQAISREIVLETLLERLMATIIENAGAQNGYLLIKEAGDWQVAAKIETQAQDTPLPLALANYVARTLEALVLNDVLHEGEFAHDPIVLTRRPHSVLCTPLLNQGRLIGVIYLENHLTNAAFTLAHVAVLDLLSRQAAISLENAKLYTNLERLVQELQQINSDLSQALRTKDEFLATMSHELRTPLHLILSQTESLQAGMYGALATKQTAVLDSMLQSSQHLLALINDILDLTRLNDNKVALDFYPVDVQMICEMAVRMIEPASTQKKLQVELSVAPVLHRIDGDERRLLQVLTNLLNNAVKFTPAGRQIGLMVTDQTAAHSVHFMVWDKGIGIPAADQARIFEQFVQLDSTFTRQHEGAGLGLTIAKRLIELHKGSVTVESTEGLGSRFTVALPWHEASKA